MTVVRGIEGSSVLKVFIFIYWYLLSVSMLIHIDLNVSNKL